MRSLIILTFFYFIEPSKIVACTCIPETIEEAYASADIIFKGQVVKIDTLIAIDTVIILENGSAKRLLRARDMIVTHMKVIQTIKGNNGDKYISVYTTYRCCTCGFPFFPDETYLVYAYSQSITTTKTKALTWNQEALTKADKKVSQVFTTSSCSRTTRAHDWEIRMLFDLLKLNKDYTRK